MPVLNSEPAVYFPTHLLHLLHEERDALAMLRAAQRSALAELAGRPPRPPEDLVACALRVSNHLRRRLLDRDVEVQSLAIAWGLPASTELRGVIGAVPDVDRAALEWVLDSMAVITAEINQDRAALMAAAPAWPGWICARVDSDMYRKDQHLTGRSLVMVQANEGRPQ